ncbi:LysR substrate-binding domain-containing protein [Zavarzinia sp.]|uniref:LysR substrate-binding domain-containing protein n=1 Tax=Zavarzinia sp. TaxID=2027920 RepID=UPI003563A02F
MSLLQGRLPSLNAVRCFAVAGRCLNFTVAAAELGVTQGAVSRQIQALEQELGLPLFLREGRSLSLTPAGELYHREVSEAIARIGAASRAARRSVESGVLSISAVPTFAMRWLIPRLPVFQAAHPGIFVDVTAGDGPPDLDFGGYHLAIRFGEPPFGDAAALRLMSEEVGAVCAPALLPEGRPFAAAAELMRHPLLNHTTRPEAWPDFLALAGLAPPPPSNAPSFEHFFMLSEAAAAGMGIALVPLFLVRDELAAGRLVQALPLTMKPRKAYYLLHGKPAGQMRMVQMFKDWIRRAAARPA